MRGECSLGWWGLDWTTLIVLAVLLLGVLDGLGKGFVRSTLELLGLAIPLYVALANYTYVGRLVSFAFNLAELQGEIIGFVIAFAAVSVASGVVIAIILRLSESANLSNLDRILGAGAAIIRNCIVVAVVLWIITSMPVSSLVPHVEESGLSRNLVRSIPRVLNHAGLEVPGFFDREPADPVETPERDPDSLRV